MYYREMPGVVESFVSAEKGFSFSKDGITKDVGHSCPRMTIFLEENKQGEIEEERVMKLERLLIELHNNNQISGYVIKIKYKRDSRKFKK